MASRLKKMIKAFGLADGIKLYSQVKIKPSGWLKSSKYNTSFYLRPKTTDYYTFDQVFLRDQYNIDLPFVPKTIIDAGANIGLASVYFAHKFPNAKIVAIEPSSANYSIVQKNIANYPQVTAFCMGLWSKDTYLEIIDTSLNENAFMVQETTAANPKALQAISINSIINSNNWQTIDILKMDIEGSEKEVFEFNYETWLPKTKAIIVEMHDNMRKGASKAIFSAISKYNFSTSISDENLVFINQDLI
jgi:FkbM family methyltransferase